VFFKKKKRPYIPDSQDVKYISASKIIISTETSGVNIWFLGEGGEESEI
jgi:hypothetical protein